MAGRRHDEGMGGIVPDFETYPTEQPPQRPAPPMGLAPKGYNIGPVDIRGWDDWRSIVVWATTQWRWGQVVVAVEANNGGENIASGGIHAEVRIVGHVGSTSFVLAEDAAAHYTDRHEELSTGPVRLVLHEGEMPDRIEIQARARMGGVAQNVVVDSQTLQATASARFG